MNMKKIIKICAWDVAIVPIVCLALISVCFISCENKSNDPVKNLKKRIDKAEMIEYIDSVYGAKLLYPDFFKVDTTGEREHVRFYYSDENIKELSLGLYYYPPRLFENVDRIIHIYELDSLYVCIEKKKYSCIMKGKDGLNFEYTCLCKCAKGRYGWIACTLTYEPQYENSVIRLSKNVKKWKPMPPRNVPVWLSDLCDFLDI